MSSRGHIASWAGIGFLHLARCEDLLVLNDDNTHGVTATFVRPDARQDVVYRIDDVAVAIVADGTVRPLRGIADDGHGSVDEQVQPVAGFLHKRAALEPDGAGVLPVAERQ